MKMRLLVLTSLNFSPLDDFLTDCPSYTCSQGGTSGFRNRPNNTSLSLTAPSSFITTDTIFPFSSDLQYSSEAVAVGADIHYVVKLNV